MRVPHQLLILCSIGLTSWFVSQSLPERVSSLASSDAFPKQMLPGDDVAQLQNLQIDSPNLFDSAMALANSAEASAVPEAIVDRLVQEPSKNNGRRSSRRPILESSSKYSQRFSMLQAFREAIGPAYKSTVELLVEDERQAYGAIVDADGWIITKDSQLPLKGKLVCRLWSGEESEVQVVSRNSALDLALLHMDRRGLQPLEWADDVLPGRGSWMITTSVQDTPAAFGIVSTGLMTVGARKVRMGVQLREDAGAVIEKVFYGTGADDAGLRSGDRIRAIDGQKLASQKEALDALKSCQAGQCVQLTIQRGSNEMETQVRMMDLSEDLIDETEMEVNGSISARSSGFSTIFMHDTVLSPNQCGGPLVNLDGRAVGINIARAGRVSSYALPASTVRAQVSQMLSSAKSSQVLTTK